MSKKLDSNIRNAGSGVIVVSFRKALSLTREVCSRVLKLSTEVIPIQKSVGRIIADDFYARMDIPSFNNSAMDGFALRHNDIKNIPTTLKILGTIPAGRFSDIKIKKGECVRIMTGAMMPQGADAVVMKEFSKVGEDDRSVEIFKKLSIGENVRYKGEDVKKGSLLIKKGSRLSPFMLGILASQGLGSVKVVRRPVVGFITTGDEIIMPTKKDLSDKKKSALSSMAGKIYNANRYTLEAALEDAGCVPLYLGHSADEVSSIRRLIEENISRIDILITVGGVSMGEYDLVKDVLKSLGAKFYFEKIQMKPGRPSGFAVLKGKPVFTLPGNVVSSLVSFDVVARQAIFHFVSSSPEVLVMEDVRSDFNFSKNDERTHILRVKIYKDITGKYFRARLPGEQGSGILSTLASSNGYVILPEGNQKINKGDRLKVNISHLFLNYSIIDNIGDGEKNFASS